MHLDVRQLRNFYYRSHLGRAVQRSARTQLDIFWPHADGETVVGFGFAVPLLRQFLPEARRVTALMPGPQGVMHWPHAKNNISVLCDEGLWPLETGSVDKLLLFHGLDASENPAAVLEECYRVLNPSGRVIFIVPNRTSLWSRREGTPFSLSRPYTPGQIEAQVKWHGFKPVNHVTALYQPPWTKRFWLKTGSLWDRVGHSIPAWRGGGILMVEVIKQVPRPKRPGLGQIISRPLGVLDGMTSPDGKLANSSR